LVMTKRLYCLTPNEYQRYFDGITPSADFEYQLKICVERIIFGINQYKAVEGETGIPWVFTALIHEMECDCSFDRQILNGQRLDEMTTIVPKGHGPWKFWHTAAIEGLQNYVTVDHWDVGVMGYHLERHNGFGYRNNGLLSPYLFSGCQWGVDLGLYGSDGEYSPILRSKQAGAYVILHKLMEKGIYAPGPQKPWPVTYLARNEDVLVYQMFLNANIKPDPELKMDGISGKKTSTAHKNFTGQYLVGDPRGEA